MECPIELEAQAAARALGLLVFRGQLGVIGFGLQEVRLLSDSGAGEICVGHRLLLGLLL